MILLIHRGFVLTFFFYWVSSSSLFSRSHRFVLEILIGHLFAFRHRLRSLRHVSSDCDIFSRRRNQSGTWRKNWRRKLRLGKMSDGANAEWNVIPRRLPQWRGRRRRRSSSSSNWTVTNVTATTKGEKWMQLVSSRFLLLNKKPNRLGMPRAQYANTVKNLLNEIEE